MRKRRRGRCQGFQTGLLISLLFRFAFLYILCKQKRSLGEIIKSLHYVTVEAKQPLGPEGLRTLYAPEQRAGQGTSRGPPERKDSRRRANGKEGSVRGNVWAYFQPINLIPPELLLFLSPEMYIILLSIRECQQSFRDLWKVA